MKITIPYRPRYPEVHAMFGSCRFSCLVAHRRFGKTVLAVNHLIRQALTCRKLQGHFAYVAPFRHQAKTAAWKYMKHFTAVIPNRVINESDLSVTLPSPAGEASIRIFGADNPDALRGTYYDGIVLDEVAQMKAEVWEETVQPALADRRGFAIFIGTPKGINLFSRIFYHAQAEQAAGSKEWGAMSFPCDKSHSLPQSEIDRLRGELSEAKFRQEMLCDFSASGEDVLISLDDARAGLEREADAGLCARWPLIIGVDVARFGDDATVFFPRRGNMAMTPTILRGKDNVDVAHRLLALMRELGAAVVNIDQGQGTGVIDIVKAMAGAGVWINEVPFGSRALEPEKYFNRRSEMWRRMAEWLRHGGSLPAGRDAAEALLSDLSAPTYSFSPGGQIKLEAKEEIKKRLSRSTDLGDALALTFAVDVAPLDLPKRPVAQERRRRRQYDPFA